jgi:hypothetical protein
MARYYEGGGERDLVVDHLKFGYEGLFNAGEVFSLVQTFFFDKGYDYYEKMNQEVVTPQGKQIKIIIEPWKCTSEHSKMSMRIKINMVDVKEVDIEKAGEKLRLNHGVLRITFDAYVFSDRKGQWTNRPLNWFFLILMEKYFYRFHTARFETWIKSDVDDLHNRIKDYLNVFKYSYQK